MGGGGCTCLEATCTALDRRLTSPKISQWSYTYREDEDPTIEKEV